MTEKQALSIIFDKLQAGEQFGSFEYFNFYDHCKLRYPYFHAVLYKTFNGFIGWNLAGSSAIKNSKKELIWLLDKIFNMTAIEFLETYITEKHLKKVISGYEYLTGGE